MECEFFCQPGTDLEWFAYWKDYCKNGGEIVLPAHRADDLIVPGDKCIHLVKAHGVHVHIRVLWEWSSRTT